jgi:hypothetical protein
MPAAAELARPAADPQHRLGEQFMADGVTSLAGHPGRDSRLQSSIEPRTPAPHRGHGQQPRGGSLQYLPHGIAVAHDLIVRETAPDRPASQP